MAHYGYLRVSTDMQTVDSQKLGLLDYANSRALVPLELVSETVSRKVAWRERELGALLDRIGPGDVLLIPEITRIGARPGQVFGFLEAAAAKGIAVHITKLGMVMDGSMQSQLLASTFAMASMIESAFIVERTREGVARARNEGKRIGRPPGSGVGASKLEPHAEQFAMLRRAGLSKTKLAAHFGVAYNTVNRYLRNRGMS